MRNSIFFALVLIAFVSCGVSKNSTNEKKDKFPKAEHYVNDFDNILTDEQETDLNNICSEYDERTTNQIVVATFKSYDPYDKMEQFCTDLYNEWKIGTQGQNNGLLIVVFKDLHKVRIEVGLGTEKILTNDVCAEIMQTRIIPEFKKGKYYEGIKGGVEESINRWK